MSGRSQSDTGHRVGHRTQAWKAAHAPVEQGLTPGEPPLPDHFRGGRARGRVREAYDKALAMLSEARLLARQDGPLLLAYAQAQAEGDVEKMNALIGTWRDREPFPEQPAAPTGIMDFLARVKLERDTFPQRMHPQATTCRELGGTEYAWSGYPGIARAYALSIVQGGILAGELMIRASNRFLKDLENGHERGLWFDPVAATNICAFAEAFCKLALMPWQVFVLANVFGWKRASGARRFTEAFVSVARKNGKTRLSSVVALYLLVADQEPAPEIYAAAVKRDQARICWKDAKRTVLDSTELQDVVQVWAHELAAGNGSFAPLASEEKSLDGLRVHGAVLDELHQWPSRDVFDRLMKATVSRIQPLVFEITTAGEAKGTFCWSKQDLCEKTLRGTFEDDSTFAAIFRIDPTDNYQDEKCWIKANPSLHNRDILKVEHLRKALAEVAQDPSGLNAFLRFHLNTWPEVQLQRQGSIPTAKWEACAGLDLIGCTSPRDACLKFLELNRDLPCFGGLDVGLTSDMSCFVMLWPKARFAAGQEPITKIVALAQFFMPEVGLLEKERNWGVPLSQWTREEFIELLPGDLTDPREIRRHILEAASLLTIRELGYDPWQARVLCGELNEAGAVRCVEVKQTALELTSPCRELLAAIHRQELVHFGNPVLAWHAGNVIFAENEKHGGTKPEKLSANEKIDGVSALVSAWHRMLAAPPESVYINRGITFI